MKKGIYYIMITPQKSRPRVQLGNLDISDQWLHSSQRLGTKPRS